ncbi:hypothetical protein N7530_012686 [Penicillium desertorum]|uniref:Uncharacterized protein n=1 Tax=Penicillium desertorum TaxID=1303715 RepID=A0A9W9WDG4_9EURO|nr:hypothetical protein N7530_012686 [Penicillium desertorum]
MPTYQYQHDTIAGKDKKESRTGRTGQAETVDGYVVFESFPPLIGVIFALRREQCSISPAVVPLATNGSLNALARGST